MKPLVIICSEEAEFFLIFNHILEAEGIASELAGSAEETLQIVREKGPQALILDCTPLSFSPASVCERLKQDPDTQGIPLVALIGAAAASQHIELLKVGVDECFVKPFAPAKLLDYLHAKVSAGASRRLRDHQLAIGFGDIEMRLDTYRVICSGKEVHLTPLEFRLLRHMLRNKNRVIGRDEFINVAWPRNVYVSARTVDVHISRLRRSLKTVSKGGAIRTIRSAGYALEEQPQ